MNILSSPRSFLRFINLILLLFFIVIIYIIISLVGNFNKNYFNIACIHKENSGTFSPNLPVMKIYGIQPDDKKLDVVKNVLKTLGYEVIFNGTKEWDVLWSHTYPFYSLKKEILHLKPHQKVNHFPGSGYLTQKNNLAALPLVHIPKSFILPSNKEGFLKYAEDNNHLFWIIKNSNHRGIKIYSGKENLDIEGTFVQEFIKDPLLISGKKFDIGVYVVLTSIDPLRVYVYNSDILLRFCKENYFPLNINSVDSYVVGDDYLPLWEVPALKYYYLDLNYTAKESLNAYIHSKGKNSKSLWHQIYQIVLNVYFSVEENLKKSTAAFGNVRNFFELVRFDFIVDEYLNVYLLEVNMSPNLSPAHFPQNELLYEQIIFNTIQLLGLVRKFHDVYRGNAEVSDRDIQVNSEQCSSKICEDSCKSTKCKLCNQCMNAKLKGVLKNAYLEFLNRGKFKRIIPVPTAKINNKELKKPDQLSQMNAYMDSWFRGKCLQDSSWCQ